MIKCPHCGKERQDDGPNHRDWGCGCAEERKALEKHIYKPTLPVESEDWRERFR